MIINHNMASLNTYRQMSVNENNTQSSLAKLSSGLRINKAGDDAAGLAISEKMRGQIRGLDQATRNSQDGISMLQTAEGALNETHSILQRMRELAVQSANDTNTADDRAQIQKEVDQLSTEIDRIGNNTEFNTKKLINGDMASAVGTTTGAILNTAVSLTVLGGTAATAASTLVSLADAQGNTFGIVSNDTITVTGKIGSTYVSTTLTVTAGTSMTEVAGALSAAFTLSSTAINASGGFNFKGSNGLTNDIGGITFTVKDSSGVIRTAATDALSGLDKTQGAKNVTVDGTNKFLIGANQGQAISININDMRASALGVNGLSVQTQSQANLSIKVLDNAIKTVSTERANLGAVQNRLEHTINNLGTSSENLTAAESRVRDVDMAKEMMNFQKNNILQQAAQAMLAQANQQPQGVLQLLR